MTDTNNEKDEKDLTNRDLRDEVKRLSEQLGIETAPGKNKAELRAQIDGLRAQFAARAAPPAAPDPDRPLAGAVRASDDRESSAGAGGRVEARGSTTPPSHAQAQAQQTSATTPKYKVAPGRSITSKRGVLGPGTDVLPRDLYSGGEERLEELAEKGVLVRT